MTGDLERTFPFRVRLHHRETFTSLERRVLARNGEPRDLSKRYRAEHHLTAEQWRGTLHRKNRSTAPPVPDHGVHHADGDTCEQCTDLLSHRWMCTSCAHGEHVEQEPHFLSPVCDRHSRWVGFDSTPEAQAPVGQQHIDASRTFEKLRRNARLDPRLYGLVSTHLTSELELSERQAFPIAVEVIAAITSTDFLGTILNPTWTFARAFRHLTSTLRRVTRRAVPETTRALWLAMGPAFAGSRTVARTGRPWSMQHAHDFPVPAAVRHSATRVGERESFANYLAQTDDTPVTAAAYLGASYQRLVPGSRARHHICRHGHEYTHTARDGQHRCPDCPRIGEATSGVNDIASQAPHLARQWDHERNGNLTPTMVSVSSSIEVNWLCRKGHSFPATPSNRTHNDSGCAFCQNRRILPGYNDFATRYPDAFSELAPKHVRTYNPHRHTPTSTLVATWTCRRCGNMFRASFADRAAGRGCRQCLRIRSVAKRGSLAATHPDLAATWVIDEDGRGPGDYSFGSRYEATWRCELDHEYPMRVERRVQGGGCPYCASRLLLIGFNDLQTKHPAVASEWWGNAMEPFEVFPKADRKFTWKCKFGHVRNSYPIHRIKSGGCPECPLEDRVAEPRR